MFDYVCIYIYYIIVMFYKYLVILRNKTSLYAWNIM